MVELGCGWVPAGCPAQGFLKVECPSGQMGSGFVDLNARCVAVVPFGRDTIGHQETCAQPQPR